MQVYPPSTGMLRPVRYAEASDARRSIGPLISSPFARRPTWVWSEYMSLAEAAIFEYAFKLGMQIAIETLTDTN